MAENWRRKRPRRTQTNHNLKKVFRATEPDGCTNCESEILPGQLVTWAWGGKTHLACTLSTQYPESRKPHQRAAEIHRTQPTKRVIPPPRKPAKNNPTGGLTQDDIDRLDAIFNRRKRSAS